MRSTEGECEGLSETSGMGDVTPTPLPVGPTSTLVAFATVANGWVSTKVWGGALRSSSNWGGFAFGDGRNLLEVDWERFAADMTVSQSSAIQLRGL